MAQIKKDTYDYLKYMQESVEAHIAAGGTDVDVGNIDQSAYKDRPVYNETYKNNALHIYKEMTGGDMGQSYE